MNRWWWAGMVLVLMFFGGTAQAAGLNQVTDHQLRALNTTSLDRYLNGLGTTYPSAPSLSLKTVTDDILHGKNPFSLPVLIRGLEQVMGRDLVREGRILGLLLILTVLGAVLSRLAEAFPQREVAALARLVVLAALIGVAITSFGVAVNTVRQMIGQLVHLMEATIPLVIVLMAGSGAITSAGLFHPLLLMTVNTVALAAKDWVLPLVLLAVSVEIVSTWMPQFTLSQLGSVLKQVAMFSLGGLLTLFLAVITMENVAGKMADGLALRTGKFLANAMIPVVGKMFSDAMDVVLRSSGLLLTALGMTAGLAVIITVAFPLMKVLIMMLFYRIGAAGAEPLAIDGVTKTLGVMANGLGLLMAVATAVALMFFLLVTVVVTSASGVAP